jgi:hypothetical protein
MEQVFVRDRLALMPEPFGAVGDPREGCKVRYPLREVLFLVTCATIAGCDDCDQIADRGVVHRDFPKEYAEFCLGTPKEDWLRVVLNRIDPALFEACFTARARGLRPGAADLIALDGKSRRRSGGTGAQIRPVHLVPAWAPTRRLDPAPRTGASYWRLVLAPRTGASYWRKRRSRPGTPTAPPCGRSPNA